MVKLKLSNSQEGMVSIITSLVIMIVVVVIILTFSFEANRESSQALDRQLTTAAYYAAESGVNDAYTYLINNPGVNTTSCTGSSPLVNTGTSSNFLDQTTSTQYTCLLVNSTPTSIQNTLAAGQSWVAYVSPTTATPVTSISITWPSQSVSCSSIGTFSANNAWPNCPAVIRVDIVPGDALTNELNIVNGTKSYFLYPSAAGSTSFPVTDASGKIENAPCAVNGSCTVSITGLSTPTNHFNYYVRVEPIYNPSTVVQISAYNASTLLALRGSQAQIDATGKSQDILRRIQTYVSLSPTGSCTSAVPCTPNYAIQSNETICKVLSVGPGFASENAPPTLPKDYTPAGLNIPFGSAQDPCNPVD